MTTGHLRVPFGAIFQTFETHGLTKDEMWKRLDIPFI